MTAEQEIIFRQLTLRAVVWDIFSEEGVDTGRLEAEMQLYKVRRIPIKKIRLKKDEWDQKDKQGDAATEASINQGICGGYMQICRILKKAGITEPEALLVTEDAGLAEYVYGLRNRGQLSAGQDAARSGQEKQEQRAGMGIVFYERGKSRTEVSADMVVLGFEEIGVQFLDRVLKRRNRLPWNILYTKRTCVREITLKDLEELYVLYEGEGMTDYTEPLMERGLEEAYTGSYIDYMYYYYGYGMWVVQDRETGKLIGRAGIEHREVQGNVLMELGYVIGTAYQKQGYATEVCQAIVSYAAQELCIGQLHCFIHPDNHASLRVAQKLGFSLCEGQDKIQDGLFHFLKNISS